MFQGFEQTGMHAQSALNLTSHLSPHKNGENCISFTSIRTSGQLQINGDTLIASLPRSATA